MSVIEYLRFGGMSTIGGDMSENDQNKANNIIKLFGEKLQQYGIQLQVPASLLKTQQSTYLFVAQDTINFHFVFSDVPGSNTILYRDFSTQGRIEIASLIHQIKIEIGDVIWAFSCSLNLPSVELNELVQSVVKEYVSFVLALQKKTEHIAPSTEAISMPEIASGLEKFRRDHPLSSKTAFIIMQFTNSKQHDDILQCIKKSHDTTWHCCFESR